MSYRYSVNILVICFVVFFTSLNNGVMSQHNTEGVQTNGDKNKSQVKMETLQNIRSVQRAVHHIKCFIVPEVKHETVCVTVPDDCVDVSYTLEELFCEIDY